MKNLILASASPRRKEILSTMGYDFSVVVSEADESFDDSLSVKENMKRIAFLKASDVSRRYLGATVIGADTVVVKDGRILTKPKDREDAFRMIEFLSGDTHSVLTGICVIRGKKVLTEVVETKVTFAPMTKEEISEYVYTDEPYDKAGGYAVQGFASRYIESIDGDYLSVVGLSARRLYSMLKKISE